METVIATTNLGSFGLSEFGLGQPVWLLGLILIVPIVWLGQRRLQALSPVRKWTAMGLRCVGVILLILLLARLVRVERSENMTLITVIDRSQSIPEPLQVSSLDYLETAFKQRLPYDQLAVVDIAEAASIAKLPSADSELPRRNTTLTGRESHLAAGIQMAMAIAPPDSAVRILLSSEGNETTGDLKEAARVARINGIPIDVLALHYQYDQEVILRRLAAPSHARIGQSVPLRFVLDSTQHTSGRLVLTLNGRAVDLEPDTPELGAVVDLRPGTNVKTVTLPVDTSGVHEFEARFVPNDPNADQIPLNNRAGAVTSVAGPGHVLVVDDDGVAGQWLVQQLRARQINCRYVRAQEMPRALVSLMDTDAVILVNTPNPALTFEQQDMLARYVTELGGGLIMTGGPEALGAGGWIGSSVAEILPVDLDPPQKKQMPKGALVLIMHACEMPMGNLWGKRIAAAAVRSLTREDMAGIVARNWQGGGNDWTHRLAAVGDKKAILKSINEMVMGDTPSLHDHLQDAYDALVDCDAAQKHVIVISDGDPQAPTGQLLSQCKEAGITVSTVAVSPHDPSHINSLIRVAQLTGGRFYNAQDPAELPHIFIKEAQVVRRPLIWEETFTPQVRFGLSELLKGVTGFPPLDGYVLSGPKEGLAQTVLVSEQGDPVLATCQSGLGRCVVFTSSVDTRWGQLWLNWDQAPAFWEQIVRWAGKSSQGTDCDIAVDVQGNDVQIQVEAVDQAGNFLSLTHVDAQVITPDMIPEKVGLEQVGPGKFLGTFAASAQGSYLVNLRYRKAGSDKLFQKQASVNVPFAPEYQDLQDNAPLLTEVAEITGGRLLTEDPNQNDLFVRAGVKIPEARTPLTEPLIKLWLIIFLLDVAVRRVALDVAGGWRKTKHWLSGRRAKQVDPTLDRLRVRREQLKQQFTAKGAGQLKARRYQGAPGASESLPKAEVENPVPTFEKRVEAKDTQSGKQDKAGKAAKSGKPAESGKPLGASHIQQLLDAKRKAKEKREDQD